MGRRLVLGWAIAVMTAVPLVAWQGPGQKPVPQPFPKPGEVQKPPPTPVPTLPAPRQPASPQASAGEPDEALLGVPIYPGAQFVGSFDAGRGQRYYLFGATATFADLVSYYKTVLKEKGELIFDVPAIHTFEIGRFREETMAFPPSVTVKDYTWNNSPGYLNPKRGAKPERFPTIIQIVPVIPAAGR